MDYAESLRSFAVPARLKRMGVQACFAVVLATSALVNPSSGLSASLIYGTSLYKSVNSNTWTGAEAAANLLGGNLVTINSLEEDILLQNTFGPSAPLSGGNNWGYWMGLYRDPRDSGYSWDHWKWISGQTVTYKNETFRPGVPGFEPNGGYSDSPYGMVWGDQVNANGTPQWNDIQNNGNAGQSSQIGIAEFLITFSASQSAPPVEGSGPFTTSLFFSAGIGGNLLNGETIYWDITGITIDDLASGSITGFGVVTNGQFDITHSLFADGHDGENFTVTAYSDSLLRTSEYQIGSYSVPVVSANSSSASVPGPIPLLALSSAFYWSRRLRKRFSRNKNNPSIQQG